MNLTEKYLYAIGRNDRHWSGKLPPDSLVQARLYDTCTPNELRKLGYHELAKYKEAPHD